VVHGVHGSPLQAGPCFFSSFYALAGWQCSLSSEALSKNLTIDSCFLFSFADEKLEDFFHLDFIIIFPEFQSWNLWNTWKGRDREGGGRRLEQQEEGKWRKG
jgi:hypothetical protein